VFLRYWKFCKDDLHIYKHFVYANFFFGLKRLTHKMQYICWKRLL